MARRKKQSDEYHQRYEDWKTQAPDKCKHCGSFGTLKLINWFGTRPEYRCDNCKKNVSKLIL